MTPVPGLVIRDATPGDVPLMLTFIRELAEFEKLLDQVTATEATLLESLFGQSPAAKALIAEHNGAAVGHAIFFFSYSTFHAARGLYLEDLYVLPAARSKGIGRELMRALAHRALELGCRRFEWSVLTWNTRAIAFYRTLGAQPNMGWQVERVTGDALVALSQPLAQKD